MKIYENNILSGKGQRRSDMSLDGLCTPVNRVTVHELHAEPYALDEVSCGISQLWCDAVAPNGAGPHQKQPASHCLENPWEPIASQHQRRR